MNFLLSVTSSLSHPYKKSLYVQYSIVLSWQLLKESWYIIATLKFILACLPMGLKAGEKKRKKDYWDPVTQSSRIWVRLICQVQLTQSNLTWRCWWGAILTSQVHRHTRYKINRIWHTVECRMMWNAVGTERESSKKCCICSDLI